METQDPIFLYVDLFCGAGGTTTGIVKALLNGQDVARVIACVNHDPKAILSHWRNHRHVKHFEEDIRTLDLTELLLYVNAWRATYPQALLVLWASLECTHFSKARGGKARKADSRTLANSLIKKWNGKKYVAGDSYVQLLRPDYIQIENVVEFKSWGPLDKNGKPVSKDAGRDYMRWKKNVNKLGYRDEWREMNSANYGAYTSRNRLFGIFAKPGLPIVFPQPTHAKAPERVTLFNDLQKWKAVKEVLNFEIEGESILTRKKRLCEKTLERIYAGLVKYVAKGDTSFISKHFSGKPMEKNIPVSGPAGSLTTKPQQALVQACFLQIHNGKSKVRSVDEPCPTVATNDRFGLVQPQFWIDKNFSGPENHQSIEGPAGTIVSKDKHSIMHAIPWVMSTNFSNIGSSVEEPLPTITANRKWHYLMNPQYLNKGGDIEKPSFTLIARMDKAPPYLVSTESGNIAIEVYPDDSPAMVRIKQFMAAYGLVDIKMRMLMVLELLKIQGFPADYRLEGTQEDKKKFIGNSVVPHVVTCWVESLATRIDEGNVIYIYFGNRKIA